jgi:putative transposase
VIAFITEHKDHSVTGLDGGAGLRWGVEPMCAVLSEHGIKIAPATYYEWVDRQPTRRELRDEQVTELIRAEREHPKTGKFASGLGSRKMWIRLRGKGHDVARCSVERLMRANGWEGAAYGSKHRTTIADEAHERFPDLVDRRFNPARPNRLWVADFTYCPTWTGMVYVAFVIDAFSRRIIGWRAARSMTTELVLDALEHAIFTRAAEGVTDLTGLVAHNDAGSQYTSIAFTQRLVDAGVDPSVGSVGDAFDNALAETTVGSFKTELIRRCGPWRDVEHIEIETLHWVDWFNTERPHDYLNDLAPAAAEELHYRHFHTQAAAG